MQESTAAPASNDTEVLADQVRALQSTLTATVLGNLALGAVVVMALRGAVSSGATAAWASALVLHCGFNVHVSWVLRARPVSARNAPRRARAAVVGAFLLGLVWAAAPLLLWPAGRPDLQFLLVFLVAGVSSGALHSLAAHLPTFHAFFWPCMSAVVLACLRQGSEVFLWMALIAAVYAAVTARYAGSLHRALTTAFRRRHEVAALAADLATQVQRTASAQRSRSRFLAAASHDLRQPVHALRLLLGPLHAAALPAPHGERARQALAAADSLSALFESLLDLSRIEAGAVQPVLCSVDLRALVDHLFDELSPLAAQRGLALRRRGPATGAAPLARTDPLLMERILRNLLTNALRYTRRGGVVVAVRPCRAGGWRVTVADTGPGMSVQAQQRAFEEFVQWGDATQRRGGFGLGLAIVRGLVDLLRHSLVLHSRPERGTRVEVTLPRANELDEPLAPLPAAGADTSAAASPELHGTLVALVDDDAAVRQATADLLHVWGANVVVSASAGEALAIWRERASPPDCLVTDLNLGGDIDGVVLAELLREEFNTDFAAFLVCACPSAVQMEAAQRAGMTVLLKPCPPEALAQALTASGPATPVG